MIVSDRGFLCFYLLAIKQLITNMFSVHALTQFTMFQSLLKLLHIINQNICQIKFPFQKELHLD